MRNVETVVGDIRRKVFAEVARYALETEEGDYSKIEELPYRIIPGVVSKYRESVFLERAIIGERIRLAIGLPLRPYHEHAPLSMGIEDVSLYEKYYEPPLVNIIKFACHACPDKVEITDCCQGCLSHPCVFSCPKDAVYYEGGRSHIDQSKCIKCGRCLQACPYNAIIQMKRPCAVACGVDAIKSDEMGLAEIDHDKCVSCGMCIVSCPFGAISDKGQIFQITHTIKKGTPITAIVAPSFLGQFGADVTFQKFTGAMKELGFSDVVEVAVGADLCAIEEAKDFLEKVPAEQPFMATSCCPAWSVMAKKQFPELAPYISMALTPMVLTARLEKQRRPDHKIVFVGPCAAKKLEASRRSIRSNVDFVITYEELMGMFEAKGINIAQAEEADVITEATGAGRGFAVSGGVANAVKEVINRMDPEREVNIAKAEGLRECKKLLQLAKAGKYNGYLLEGMGCPGGCVAGTGTLQPHNKSAALINKYVANTEDKNALDSKFKAKLEELSEEH